METYPFNTFISVLHFSCENLYFKWLYAFVGFGSLVASLLCCFLKEGYLVFQKLFSRYTLAENRTHVLPKNNFCRTLPTRSRYFTLFFFKDLSYNKPVSDNIAVSENIPNKCFIYKISSQKYTEISKQKICKDAFAIPEWLLLFQFVTCNMKPFSS